MINQQYSAKLERFQELLITTLLGDIPTIVLGPHLRRLLYRRIFASMGEKVYIQHGVEFLRTAGIEIGSEVHIFKNVRLDAKGHPNNRIHLGKGVAIERNVDIGCLVDTHRPEGAVILGSTSPLRLDPLRCLTQRWFSPQALTFLLPGGSCIAANFV